MKYPRHRAAKVSHCVTCPKMSMVQMKQADLMQVFLPYAWDDSRKQTYYESIRETGFRALLPENTAAKEQDDCVTAEVV